MASRLSFAPNSTMPGTFLPGAGGANYSPTPVSYPVASGVAPGAGKNLTDLTSYINQLNREAQTQANQARIPGAAGLEQQSSNIIGQELKGQLPSDVLAQIQQQQAERGVAGGVAGSPNSNAAYLRAIGLTSLGQQQQGEQNLSSAYARNPAAPLFDPTTQLMTPYQAGSLTLAQQQEADRVALEQQRLALEGASIGSRGGGGGGYGTAIPAPTTGGGGPGEVVGYSPERGSGALGIPDLGGGDTTQAWWQSIGFQPGQGAPTGTGTFYAGANPDLTQGQAAAVQGYEDLFNPDLYQSPDASYQGDVNLPDTTYA